MQVAIAQDGYYYLALSVRAEHTASGVQHAIYAKLHLDQPIGWKIIREERLGYLEEDQDETALSTFMEQGREWTFKTLISPLQHLTSALSDLLEGS